MEMDLGVGCFGHAGQTTNGRLGAHHLIIRTLIQLWISQDGALHGLMESSCETHAQSTVMRVMHVKLPSHSARGRYFVKAGFAMRLRLPGTWPGNVSPEAVFAIYPNASSQCVFAYPMCLRNASSQCVCATQCVFTMRLRHPMRLHNASAPSNASSPNASSECVCACFLRLRRLGLFLTNASSQCGCVFRSFTTLPQDAAIYICVNVKEN